MSNWQNEAVCWDEQFPSVSILPPQPFHILIFLIMMVRGIFLKKYVCVAEGGRWGEPQKKVITKSKGVERVEISVEIQGGIRMGSMFAEEICLMFLEALPKIAAYFLSAVIHCWVFTKINHHFHSYDSYDFHPATVSQKGIFPVEVGNSCCTWLRLCIHS